jgi:hypothetical protein
MRKQRVLFFAIIGITMIFIGVVAGLNMLLTRPAAPPDAPATATAIPFLATVTAETGADAISLSGIPNVSLGNHTWDGLEFDFQQVNYDAWPLIKLENQFNSPPQEGKRMIMVTLVVTNVAGEESVTLSDSNFRIVGEYQTPYSSFDPDTRCGVTPEDLFAKVKPAETIKGNICMQVPISESGLVLVYDGNGIDIPKIYFALPEVGQ